MPVPLIGIAASTALGAWQAHNQSKAAGDSADMQKAFMDKQSGLADKMTDFAGGQFSAGQPALNKAMQYYTTLASGNRSAIQNTLAPQISSAADTYGGAEKGMMARMAPGGDRNAALAQLYQQRAGQMALMPMQARTGAMGSLADLGTQAVNRGQSALGQAGSMFSQAGGATQNLTNLRQQAISPWAEFGSNMMTTFLPYLMGQGGKSGASGGKVQNPMGGAGQAPNLPFNPSAWSGFSGWAGGNKPITSGMTGQPGSLAFGGR